MQKNNFSKNIPMMLAILLVLAGIFVYWGKPAQVTAPDVTVKSLADQSSGQIQAKGSDVVIQSALSGIKSQAGNYYNSNEKKSYVGLCSSSGVRQIAEDLKSNLHGKLMLNCLVSKESYSAWGVLDNGTYYCVDSSGFDGMVQKKPVVSKCQ
jgi:hypothetical protein